MSDNKAHSKIKVIRSENSKQLSDKEKAFIKLASEIIIDSAFRKIEAKKTERPEN